MAGQQYGQAVNTASIAAGQAVSSAISGQDVVGGAMAAVNPTMGYVQAGAAALQALGTLSQNTPTASTNVSTPNFNNAPTAIVNFGSGGVNSTASPVNTQNPSATSAAQTGGGLSGISDTFKYIIIGVIGLAALKTMRGT